MKRLIAGTLLILAVGTATPRPASALRCMIGPYSGNNCIKCFASLGLAPTCGACLAEIIIATTDP